MSPVKHDPETRYFATVLRQTSGCLACLAMVKGSLQSGPGSTYIRHGRLEGVQGGKDKLKDMHAGMHATQYAINPVRQYTWHTNQYTPETRGGR